MEAEPYTGVVSPERVVDYSNELRTTDCSICGANEIVEKAVGRGLETVIKCEDCGFEYFRRGES